MKTAVYSKTVKTWKNHTRCILYEALTMFGKAYLRGNELTSYANNRLRTIF